MVLIDLCPCHFNGFTVDGVHIGLFGACCRDKVAVTVLIEAICDVIIESSLSAVLIIKECVERNVKACCLECVGNGCRTGVA